MRKQIRPKGAAYITKAEQEILVSNLRVRGLYPLVERYARKFYVTVEEACSTSRLADVCKVRRAVWRELRATTRMSLPELGSLFGRDHTTVIHALAKTRPEQAATDARAKLRVI